MHPRFERGAVVRCQRQTWVIWTYPRAKVADPIALPMRTQTTPLHRSHARIEPLPVYQLGVNAVLIATLEPRRIPHRECEQVAQLDIAAVDRIAQVMHHAREAEQREDRMLA